MTKANIYIFQNCSVLALLRTSVQCPYNLSGSTLNAVKNYLDWKINFSGLTFVMSPL